MRNEDKAALPRKLNMVGNLDIVRDKKEAELIKALFYPKSRQISLKAILCLSSKEYKHFQIKL